jgi:hypothetical protein
MSLAVRAAAPPPNGLVTLTQAALASVAPSDAGAASGLVNVVQQLGGTLDIAVLVTVVSSASKHAAKHPLGHGSVLAQTHHAFAYSTDRIFTTATIFLVMPSPSPPRCALPTGGRLTCVPAPDIRSIHISSSKE